jgi:phytoene/squalene synthetase
MSTLYEQILDAIEANNYDVLHRRAFVSFPAKLSHALRLALRSDMASSQVAA